MADDKPWRDEELMRELYHGKRMSQQEIADYFDNEITQAGVGYCLDELGIEKRSRSESTKDRWHKRPLRPCIDTTHGYKVVKDGYDGEDAKVYMHRLLAAAVYGVDEMDGKVVHHKNEIPWDNRPDNIELMTPAEHAEHHHRETSGYGNQGRTL